MSRRCMSPGTSECYGTRYQDTVGFVGCTKILLLCWRRLEEDEEGGGAIADRQADSWARAHDTRILTKP